MTQTAKAKILIVGAGGFIGGFIADEGLRRGYDVYVTVRESTSRRYLTDGRLHFVVLDYEDAEGMEATLRATLPEGEKWKYIIYNLGATKCANFLDFKRINFEYLRRFAECLKAADLVPEKLLYMSSLSALGAWDEKEGTPARTDTVPDPNTAYGLSKVQAESYLMHMSGIPYVIFRATGVYGPHERDYLMMIKSIDGHFDFGVGFKPQMLTFIYVADLVNAMYDALASDNTTGHIYNIAEERAYSQKEFRQIVSRALGGRFVIPVRLPMCIVYVASYVAEKLGRWRGKASTLNRDKYKIMRQRNWRCDVSDAQRDFGFKAEWPLERGVAETVAAYLEGKRRR